LIVRRFIISANEWISSAVKSITTIRRKEKKDQVSNGKKPIKEAVDTQLKRETGGLKGGND
jgi:hypothetical protein